ncbi:zinc finger, CCHC-type containing protein [Tanacetum coccineum]
MRYAPNNAPFAPKPKTPLPPKKDKPAKDAICHECGEIGHWRRNCPVHLAELIKRRSYLRELALQGLWGILLLFDDGFVNRFDENNVISVSKNNLVYFMVVPRDGIFKIDMSCSNTNDSSMYAVSNKRAKITLDSAHLWHCRLGHISKKRIEKLQHDRLLNSINTESLGKCVSCLSEKMARKPYSY